MLLVKQALGPKAAPTTISQSNLHSLPPAWKLTLGLDSNAGTEREVLVRTITSGGARKQREEEVTGKA